MLAGLAVVAGGVTAAVVVPGGPAPAPVTPGALITTFQPGELQTVPDACQTVPAATVQQYLPGPVKQAAPLAIDGTAESACNWTIDRAPVYRLLELNLLAYAPNGLASGDGSATDAAMDSYAQTLQDLRDPPRRSADPPATISMLSGLGNEAFSATQVFRRGGAVTGYQLGQVIGEPLHQLAAHLDHHAAAELGWPPRHVHRRVHGDLGRLTGRLRLQ